MASLDFSVLENPLYTIRDFTDDDMLALEASIFALADDTQLDDDVISGKTLLAVKLTKINTNRFKSIRICSRTCFHSINGSLFNC